MLELMGAEMLEYSELIASYPIFRPDLRERLEIYAEVPILNVVVAYSLHPVLPGPPSSA